jgi:NTP pyrophosphatase (non-canonical NTP hydrolase)
VTNETKTALQVVAEERVRQDVKWGEQNHDPFLYLTILGEEYGEACEAALRLRFSEGDASALRSELVQIAAVAVACVECLDRGAWSWGAHGTTGR